ncbi:MAG TPA: hypothetical protein VMI32_07190 [Candidatus Solibacter sp.]|nr:hypothetical protein [Candidatus Solibacter sp.]
MECKEKKRQERAERKERAARESLAKQRRAWENEQIEFALRSLPRSDFSQAKQAVVHAIRDALKGIEPNDPASTISCAVDSAVQSVLAPIRREQAIERAIMESFGELPFEIRKIRLFSLSDAPLTEWEARAFRQAREAISGLSLNATAVEIRAAASQGVKRVAQQYANEKNESSHRRAIESMLNRVNGDKEKIAVREALDRLPVGCASVELQRAFDAVLTPIRERAKAAEETKRKEMKAEWDAERCLWRVREYIEELARDGDCNLNFWDRFQLAEKIKNRIRPRLIQHVLRGEADDGFARELIEEAVDAEL